MLSRRHLCGAGAIAGGMLTLDRAFAADICTAPTRERQAAISPEDALNKLKAGNERFLTRNMRNCDLLEQVRSTAGGQFPSSVVIGCMDSRVPPELVFDQRIGDVFTARVAGNIINSDIVGSAEYATKIVGARLIVVLGHSECGAVKGAIDGAKLGMLTELLAKIGPAIEASESAPGDHSSKNGAFVQDVARANAKFAAGNLTQMSDVLRNLVANKQLKIVSAMHDVATGRVTFME